MRRYRLGAHTKSDLKVHLVRIPKYRKAVLTGEVAIRVRDLIRQIAAEHELEIISGLAGVERGGRYLDLGCSAGLYTRNLAPGDGGEVIGIDISPSMLKEAARRARGIGARPSFARADAHSLPFADACFSGSVCAPPKS